MNAKYQQPLATALAVFTACLPMRPLRADPCGMVPPITAKAGSIERIGLQKTYVFYKNGIETLVLRPGYRGQIEDFGMLIPFPSPPAIRKVADDVFAHVAAAVDPPEVVVDLRWRNKQRLSFALGDSAAPTAALESSVRVLNQEAVGMYEVAVLEAGSAQALRRWMDSHGYRYPDGMDAVCEDYVEQEWCFVAVKTRVGVKGRVDARPGMRKVDPKLPAGATFDGHVQGMGFRFRTDELVVPMRLSAFNPGPMRNVVYVLSDQAVKASPLPDSFVVRQISGVELLRNVTQPLPLRILGGTIDDIPEWRRANLANEQDPTPHNGLAKELFAADLLAARRGALALDHEEAEKRLLNIGEELGLRGTEVDALIATQLAAQRRQTVDAALNDLASMTMTVLDADFPRDVLGRENLTFTGWAMPGARNAPHVYDAKAFGPAVRRAAMVPAWSHGGGSSWWRWLAGGAVLLVVIAGLTLRRRGGGAATLGLAAALLLGAGTTAAAPGPGAAGIDPTTAQLVARLSEPERAAAAVETLVQRGAAAVPHLLGEATEGADLQGRGWALVCLARIGGERVDRGLATLHDSEAPDLVRTWAAAARVQAAPDLDGVLALVPLVQRFPAAQRPLSLRLAATTPSGPPSPNLLVRLLRVTVDVPGLQDALTPAILAAGRDPLLAAATRADDLQVRRRAVAYLGSLANAGDASVGAAVVAVFRFDPEAQQTPWHGGPLFVPGIAWPRDDARALAAQLLRWHVWADRHDAADTKKQIHNNLRSLQLARAAGYQSPGWKEVDTLAWLRIWHECAGQWAVEAILREQGVLDDARYRDALQR
ncbi:MAG: DUF2330 domain-containing protein [Planctomycetota bacterium]